MLRKGKQIGRQTLEGKETKGIKAVFLESHFSVCSLVLVGVTVVLNSK